MCKDHKKRKANRSLHSGKIPTATLVLLALFVALSIFPVVKNAITAHAQSGIWSEPVKLSLDVVSSWFPDLSVDGMGNVHVVWNSDCHGSERKMSFLFYTVWNGQSWLEPIDLVVSDCGAAIRNSIAADNAGNVHLLYNHKDWRTLYKTSPATIAGSAASWSQPYGISGTGANYMSDIAVDSKGVIHAVWDEMVPVKADQEDDLCQWQAGNIFYRRSTDGGQTWSRSINLSNSATGSGRAQVEIDSSEVIHVAWDEGWNHFCQDETSLHGMRGVYVFSSDGGESWSAPTTFSYPENTNAQTVVASDGRGGVMAVWRTISRDEIYYDWSSDGGASWCAPCCIPGIYARPWGTPYDIYTMKADSAGNIHLIVVGRLSPADETLGLYHLEWDGSSWSAPTTISAGGFPDYPRLTIGGGNKLHVVWFDRYGSAFETSDRLTVWYSSSQSASPAQTPVPPPTSTPTPTATPLATATPTATPYPTLAPGGTALPDGLYTESDDLLRLLVGLGPVLILVTAILAIRFGWLRRSSGR